MDPLEDMTILGRIGASIPGLLVPADSPLETAADLVAAAEADPGALRWSHPGGGSLFQPTGVAFLQADGIAVRDVPFAGGSKARDAVAAGQVESGFMGVRPGNGFEAQVRPLGVSGAEPDPANPDVPALAERGPPVVAPPNPQIVLAPPGLPGDVAATLAGAVEAAATRG